MKLGRAQEHEHLQLFFKSGSHFFELAHELTFSRRNEREMKVAKLSNIKIEKNFFSNRGFDNDLF